MSLLPHVLTLEPNLGVRYKPTVDGFKRSLDVVTDWNRRQKENDSLKSDIPRSLA